MPPLSSRLQDFFSCLYLFHFRKIFTAGQILSNWYDRLVRKIHNLFVILHWQIYDETLKFLLSCAVGLNFFSRKSIDKNIVLCKVPLVFFSFKKSESFRWAAHHSQRAWQIRTRAFQIIHVQRANIWSCRAPMKPY